MATTTTVNQDTLLALTCNYCGFIVVGIYDNGVMLKAATTKKDKDNEVDRIIRLSGLLHQLGLNAKVTKLASMQNQIEVMIKD